MFDNDLVVAILCGALLDSSLATVEGEVRVSKEDTEAGQPPGDWGVQIDAESDDEFYVLKRVLLKEESDDGSDDGSP